MSSIDVIRRLHAHRRWVNAKLVAVAETMSPGQLHQRHEIGRGSVWDSLVHLYVAESNWLTALEGNPITPSPDDPVAFAFDSLDSLKETWRALDARWCAYLDALTDADLSKPITKVSNSSGRGVSFVTPALDILLHVCTHAQYTTAQCVNMMRRAGVPAKGLPDSMLITMSRSEAAGKDLHDGS